MNWIVHTKGGPESPSFEISVIRSSNTHGQDSYGRFGPDKLLVSSSGGPCNDRITPAVWDRLLKVAEETAAELNQKP